MDAILSVLKALADPTRLRLVRVLRRGAFPVNELVSILAVGQSRVSRHLKILLDSGLVRAERQGSWVFYRLAPCWESPRRAAGGAARFLRLLGREVAAVSTSDDAEIAKCLETRRERSAGFFRDLADRWDDRRDRLMGPPDYLGAVVERVGAVGTVVDLGTGTGVLLERLSQTAARVIGVDGAPEMLRVARRRIEERKLANVELRLGQLEHLPLADGHADAMVANMVLHHVADPLTALREIRRGLKAEGRLVLADLEAHGREEFRDELGDLWLGFAASEIDAWLAEAGFEVERGAHIGLGAQKDPVPAGGVRPPEVFIVSARRR